MASFKDLKKNMYTVPSAVRALNDVLKYVKEDASEDIVQQVTDEDIEMHIYKADAIIEAYLTGVYGSLAGKTPYYDAPMYIVQNYGEIILDGVTLAGVAITEQWKIEFTGVSKAFNVYGSFSGSQGSGTLTTNFTATDSDLVIASANWRLSATDNLPAEGDVILIGAYVSHPTVKYLSTLLAAAGILDAKYSMSEEDVSGWSKVYYKRAMDLLNKLVDSKSNVSLDGTAVGDVEHEGVQYDIDEHGYDITKYRDLDNDSLPYE